MDSFEEYVCNSLNTIMDLLMNQRTASLGSATGGVHEAGLTTTSSGRQPSGETSPDENTGATDTTLPATTASAEILDPTTVGSVDLLQSSSQDVIQESDPDNESDGEEVVLFSRTAR